MNPRTCIVSRAEREPDDMVRFVLDGDGRVVPDINRKLPGRGVWVTSRRTLVEEACKRNSFERGFKKRVLCDQAIPDLVSQLLSKAALNLLAMTRKAGVMVSGRSKVEEMLRAGNAEFVLHGVDASEDGKKKIRYALSNNNPEVPVFELFQGEELDRISGVANTVHVAARQSGIAVEAKQALTRIISYEEM